MMCLTPRLTNKADKTPVPTPMSKARSESAPVGKGGKGALATKSMYSPRMGENTP